MVGQKRYLFPFHLSVLILFSVLAFGNYPDTTFVNQCFKKGEKHHFSNSDSALYYYHLCIRYYEENVINSAQTNISQENTSYLTTIIKANNAAGNIFYFDDQYNRAEQYYERSLELAHRSNQKQYIAQSQFDLGYIKYVTSRYSEAKSLFDSSALYWESQDKIARAIESYNALGLSHRRLGDFNAADSCYSLALNYAEQISDSLHLSDIKTNRGILFCENGKLEEGMELFRQALDYYMAKGNLAAVSSTYLNIGKVMTLINEDSTALEYFLKSIEIEEALQRKSQLILPYFNVGELYMKTGDYKRGYEYCKKIRILSGEIGSRPFKAECDFLEGKYYYQISEYDSAQEFITKSVKSAKDKKHSPFLAETLLWSAKTYFKTESLNQALERATEAWQIASEMKMILIQTEAAHLISEIYELKNNYKQSLEWHKKHKNYSDSIRIYTQQKEIKRMEAGYNYEREAHENELLRNQNTLQEQKLRTRTAILLALISGILLSFFIIILVIKRSRDARIMHHQQQMINLKELEETGKKLDGKERELASKMMFLNQKNEMINRLIHRLQELQNSEESSTKELKTIVNELRVDSPQSNWKEFELQFNSVHPDFYKRLYEKYPDLSSYEQRICAFLRMNLNTKEIASITGRSHKSIEVTRSRIRKKINLSRKDNLSSKLASI